VSMEKHSPPAATLRRWSWILPLIVSFLGILLALTTGDHRLASRSAAVLLATYALVSLQDLAD
jgi:hypothetical protein